MSVKLETREFHYKGGHSQPPGEGGRGTTLTFDIVLEPTVPTGYGKSEIERRDGLHWRAVVDVFNGDPEDRRKPKSGKEYRAEAMGKNPIATLEKLADNLRRVADALDAELERGLLVPIVLHRRKEKEETDPEPQDQILEEGG